jgi:hypothetical protein
LRGRLVDPLNGIELQDTKITQSIYSLRFGLEGTEHGVTPGLCALNLAELGQARVPMPATFCFAYRRQVVDARDIGEQGDAVLRTAMPGNDESMHRRIDKTLDSVLFGNLSKI